MSMNRNTAVLWNQSQGLQEGEQDQARANINAAKNAVATQSSNGLMSAADKTKLDGIEAGAEVNVQSDWSQTNDASDDYIKNKPENLVQDASYVHTDNNFTDAYKDKLDGIEAGAEVNVQSDWSQSNTSADDYIKNKPNNLVQDASYVHTDNNFTNADKSKLDGIAAGAEVNVQSDWDQSDNTADDYIKNKPQNLVQDASYVHTDNNFTTTLKNKLDGIEAGAEVNVQANWSQSDNTKDDYIKNKPSNLVQDASYVHTDNNFTNAYKSKLDGIESGAEVNVQSDWNQSNSSADDYIKNKPSNLVQDASYVHTDNNFTTAEKNKLSGIQAGAEVNVQADWSQTNSSYDDYIKNKPGNATTSNAGLMSSGDKTKLDGIAAGAEVNVQSDWNQSNTSADDYIKNKPSVPSLSWSYDTQGSTTTVPETTLNIHQDTLDLKMGTTVLGSLVPTATPSSTIERYLKLHVNADIPVWAEATPEIFIASYNNTSFSNVYAAYNAGKLIVMRYNSQVYALPSRVSSEYIYFSTINMAGNLLTAGARHFVCSNSNGWYMYPNYANGIMDIHFPSVMTTKSSVTLQDSYDDWLRIGSIIIGGHGTSGGGIQVGIKGAQSGTGAYSSGTLLYDINHRTNSPSDTDNTMIYGSISFNQNYSSLFQFSQYDGTATVDCSYILNFFDTNSTNPSHYHIELRKTYANATMVYVSGTHSWGEYN